MGRATGACPLAALSVLVALLGGCAAVGGWDYVDEPGVTVAARLADGSTFSGRLVALEDGALVVDRSIPKTDRVEVVRRRGEEIVLDGGVAVGTARESRTFDIVARQKIPHGEFRDLRVATRTYFGWGSLIAAGLAFLVVTAVEEL